MPDTGNYRVLDSSGIVVTFGKRYDRAAAENLAQSKSRTEGKWTVETEGGREVAAYRNGRKVK